MRNDLYGCTSIMVIKPHSLLLGSILPLVFSMLTSFAIASPQIQATHIVAIGVCPPWKNQPASICTKGVVEVTKTLSERLDIPTDNQHILLNEAATTQGVVTLANTLRHKMGPTDRLIIYANLHAGAADPSQPAGPENDIFVFWSEKEPPATAFALAEQVWMQARDFASLILGLPATEIIVFLDACESDAASSLLLHSHPDHAPSQLTAVVTSASASQAALFAADQSQALFTQQLNLSLTKSAGSLADAVTLAAKSTQSAATAICSKTEKSSTSSLAPCAQTPVIHDPDHLLTKLSLLPL